MKKTLLFTAAIVGLMLCSCTKESSEPTADGQEFELIVNASLEDGATKTYFVPDGRKVYWLSGDKLGAKYKKTTATSSKNDNLQLSLASGAGTASATFKGKYNTNSKTGDTTSAVLAGNKIVFYYPYISTVSKTGSVSDYADFTLGNTFPKVQNTNDVLMDPNLMFGIGEVSGWPTTTESTCVTNVSMKNVMGVLDFTIKGTGSVKRLHITDLNESAQKMWGDETISIVNGDVQSISVGSSSCASDRTIIAEFNKPIGLTAAGAHAYITVLPRTYSAGIRVCVELTTGDYMVKDFTNGIVGFEVKSNSCYQVPALEYSSSAAAGVGYSDGSLFSYKTFTDARDANSYRFITLDTLDVMIDNLRYIPKDYTPSNKATDVCIKHDETDGDGIWYPVVLNAAGTGVQFGTAADAARFGYLYNCSLALIEDETTIVDALKNAGEDKTKQAGLKELLEGYEGARGICPDKWHIPDTAEFSAICKSAGVTIKGATGVNISPLAEKGFTMRDFGYIAIASETSKTGTLMTFVSNKLNMSEVLLSTPFSYKQMYAAQFTNSNNTIAMASYNILSGGAVRCVRSAE